VNSLKQYIAREQQVNKLTVIAEETTVQEPISIEDAPGCPKIELTKLLEEFNDVLRVDPGQTDTITLRLDTGNEKPICLPPYRVPDKLLNQVKEEVDKLCSLGIIEPSTAAWSAPIVPLVKPNGSIRLCIDYRRLNSITCQEHYFMPELSDIMARVGQCKVLSKMDLAQGFHQITVEPGSRDKTTFVCPFGRFRYVRMPFGLKNAPALFQRMMEKVLDSCKEYASCYIDDVIVYSRGWEEHLVHLRRVFSRLRAHHLTVKPSKCEFGKMYLEYLGHVVGNGRLAIPQHRVEAIQKFIQPVTQKDLRSFLGTLSYYRKFIPGFAEQSALLSPATSKMAPRVVQWSPEMVRAFQCLISKLCNASEWCVPVVSDSYSLHTDASGRGIGAVLSVERDGVETPTAYFSRQLRGAELRYSVTEWEALAVVAAVDHFLPLLYGRQQAATRLGIETEHAQHHDCIQEWRREQIFQKTAFLRFVVLRDDTAER